MNKYDRRRKYYLVLDCETASLPCVARFTDEEQRKRVAIAKPLIYDLGWQVIDQKGNVYARKNYLISEIFSVPSIFDTAYYASKRPIYLERLQRGEISVVCWETAIQELIADMQAVEAVGAYNAMFDFKKALPYTDLYISQLYSPSFQNWLESQERSCTWLAQGNTPTSHTEFEAEIFRFRGATYKLFDLWGLSCEHILNCDEYKNMCIEQEWETASGKYFKTSAETAYRYIAKQNDFNEAHLAIDDVTIESELFALIVKKSRKKWSLGITCFPFRGLGTVEDYKGSKGLN